jgi:hypothetical protein
MSSSVNSEEPKRLGNNTAANPPTMFASILREGSLGGRLTRCLFSNDATRKARKSATIVSISKCVSFSEERVDFLCFDIILRAPEYQTFLRSEFSLINVRKNQAEYNNNLLVFSMGLT